MKSNFAMDLGCLDLGCISLSDEKESSDLAVDYHSGDGESIESVSANSKQGKNKTSPQGNGSALNKLTLQIKKPLHRKTSPLNWFPRKKVDSYLHRKIKLLQEVGGMNTSLDETLGDSNPHYCKVEREKIAARKAACVAMEARKAAMIEASWCRILHAARIQNKEAEELLLKAEKEVADAFEAATANGVIMHDAPDRPRKHLEIETSSSAPGKGTATTTTHTVKASFETAFEVDRQVAAAVKTAFTRLANCPSFDKDEFKDLLHKIRENPDKEELETESPDEDRCNLATSEMMGRRSRKRLSPQKFKSLKLIDIMFERLKRLQDDELASLATIVATSGLNATLAKVESHQAQGHRSELETQAPSMDYFMNGAVRKKQDEPELPRLDKFLFKRMTKLEREVQEAKNLRKTDLGNEKSNDKSVSTDDIPDLGSVLVKHSSKLEREIEQAKRTRKKIPDNGGPKSNKKMSQEGTEVLGLDKFLVKHVSRLEREVEEARSKRKNNHGFEKSESKQVSDTLNSNRKEMEKENVNSNPEIWTKEKMDSEVKENGILRHGKPPRKTGDTNCESLDKVLVKHVSRLEKEKMGIGRQETMMNVKTKGTRTLETSHGGGLDQILVKHKPRLEREKLAATTQSEDQTKQQQFVSRREARERELQEAWGGIGLGNSMRPHVSRLEREKAAWLKAEEEERRAAMQETQQF